jgi:hypothetical protein
MGQFAGWRSLSPSRAILASNKGRPPRKNTIPVAAFKPRVNKAVAHTKQASNNRTRTIERVEDDMAEGLAATL